MRLRAVIVARFRGLDAGGLLLLLCGLRADPLRLAAGTGELRAAESWLAGCVGNVSDVSVRKLGVASMLLVSVLCVLLRLNADRSGDEFRGGTRPLLLWDVLCVPRCVRRLA